jgi:hypothetical protein
MIVESISSPKDFRNLILTNSTTRKHALPVLYRTLDLYLTTDLLERARGLIDPGNPGLKMVGNVRIIWKMQEWRYMKTWVELLVASISAGTLESFR